MDGMSYFCVTQKNVTLTKKRIYMRIQYPNTVFVHSFAHLEKSKHTLFVTICAVVVYIQNQFSVTSFQDTFFTEQNFHSIILLFTQQAYIHTIRLGTQLNSSIEIMSTPHPPCGLTKQEVLNWRENGLLEVVGGLCQNPHRIRPDDPFVPCGCPVGEHPSEMAGGNIFSNQLV